MTEVYFTSSFALVMFSATVIEMGKRAEGYSLTLEARVNQL